jgi:lipopolysaccharide export system permease protein
MLKTLDKLLIKSFILPMLLTFGIATFVLIMQFFWKYVDEIIGKGLSIWHISELVFYLAMTLVPMALPIAILISSVMVMGNLGERYELSSMKSAGIPLLRIMAPLVVASFLTMIASFLCANYVIPESNLKFQARLYDIRKQKPALNIQEGIFNNDFKGYTIRAGSKGKDNQSLEDVLIYDQTPERRQENIQILSKKGEMYTTPDRRFLVLSLTEGKQYQDANGENGTSSSNYPFVRTSFKTWEKVFDMSEFDLDKTNEELFKNHYQMMTGEDLLSAIDTIHMQMNQTKSILAENVRPYYYYKKNKDTSSLYQPLDTSKIVQKNIKYPYQLLEIHKRETARQKGMTLANRIKEFAYTSNSNIARAKENEVEHWLWFHRKIVFALACFTFIFIGAPLGAIIRKGGFGWPMLIAIVGFMTFIVLFMTGEKIAKEQVVPVHIGLYIPIYVLFPLGFFLTYKAMMDSTGLNLSTYSDFFGRIRKLFKKSDSL